MINEVVSR